MKLDEFKNADFNRGASRATEIVWHILGNTLFSSWMPGSGWRVLLLRAFGAEIGVGVVIKPRVRVKFPWKLRIGNHSWIGEAVWIDNLDNVTLGDHVCLSQGAYLCTGSHDWLDETFSLITRPITIASYAWIAAFCVLAPGTMVGEGAVLRFGSRARGRYRAWHVHADREELKPRGTEAGNDDR